MRPHRGVLAWSLLVCLGCQPPARDVQLILALPHAIGCRPTEVTTVEVRALGDFPPGEPTFLVFDPAAGVQTIDRFPPSTELVAVEARGSIGSEPWAGGGVAVVDGEAGERIVTLLRYGRSCPLPDSSARVPEGAAVAALGDGRLWIGGGHDEDGALEGIVTLRPGDALATRSDARLFVKRTAATATVLDGELVVVAGGSAAVGGEGVDTLELLRFGGGEEARIGEGFLALPRREHAAVAIGKRAVLLAGGRERTGGPPHAEIEIVTVDEAGSSAESRVVARLAVARALAHALALDDGRVAIAGGVDARGEPATAIELFDPETGTLDRVPGLPARRDAAYAALPGARIAQIGGRTEEGWSGDVDVAVDGAIVTLPGAIPPLEAPRATSLGDGRVLVVGREAGRASGIVLDVGTLALERVEASRAATVLVPLADGSIAEGDPTGVSAIRIDLRTPLDSLPATLFPALPEDRAHLALDAPRRWRATAGELVSEVDGARFDVPGLRFAAFSLELRASGPLEV
ncbi:MAG TPA: kelch repeat-containing protein, partial [Sandaracinaceae bacterium]